MMMNGIFTKKIEEWFIREKNNGFHHLLGSAQSIQSEEMAKECHIVYKTDFI